MGRRVSGEGRQLEGWEEGPGEEGHGEGGQGQKKRQRFYHSWKNLLVDLNGG